MPTSKELRVKYICKGPKVAGGGRISCGNDISAIVDSIPEDGEDHMVPCPLCGTQIKVTKSKPDESPDQP